MFSVRLRKPDINWEDPQAQKELLGELVQDARAILKVTEHLPLEAGERAARELLAAVAEQDIVEQPDGTVKLKDGVAKDRVISTTDPEMRHGRKSSKGRFNGYKAHIMESVGGEIITGVAVTAANAPDAEPLSERLEQQSKAGIKVSEILGDTAYGSGDTRVAMAERGVKLIAPVPPEVKGEVFPKSAFDIDLTARTCRCPAGHTVKLKGHPGESGRFEFGALCRECPLRGQSTKSKTGRVVVIHRHEEYLQQGRAEQRTDAFKESYRKRPRVERRLPS